MRPLLVDWLARILPYDVAATIAPGWFTMVGLAGLVTLFWMMRIARRERIEPSIVATAVLWCYVAAVAAGIAMPMLLDAIEQKVSVGVIHLRWAGMTSFWGYLAGTFAVIVVCRDHGIGVGRFADLTVAPLGLALALARTGCFLAGCDYGKVSSLPWALRFPAGSPAWADQVAAGLVPASRAASLPVHPTELYEALLGLAICALGVLGTRRDGRLFLRAVAVYCIGRIAIEVLRGDLGRGIYGGLSSGQIFSALVLVALAARAVVQRARATRLVMAAATVMVLVGASAIVDAQPAPAPTPTPPSQQQPQPQPQPYPPQQPYPYPQQPYPQQPYPYPYPPPPQGYPPPGTRAEAPPAEGRHLPGRLEIGVLGGGAFPLNRRGDQVPPLAGFTLSAGLAGSTAGVWLDLESYGNKDASHGTALVSGSAGTELGSGLVIGGRAGVGATLVNFKDPVFRDASGLDLRVEATAEYPITSSFVVWARPLSLDVLSAASLGGPIMSWQLRIGIAYRSRGNQ